MPVYRPTMCPLATLQEDTHTHKTQGVPSRLLFWPQPPSSPSFSLILVTIPQLSASISARLRRLCKYTVLLSTHNHNGVSVAGVGRSPISILEKGECPPPPPVIMLASFFRRSPLFGLRPHLLHPTQHHRQPATGGEAQQRPRSHDERPGDGVE